MNTFNPNCLAAALTRSSMDINFPVEDFDVMDAPEFIPLGSTRWIDGTRTESFPAMTFTLRGH